VAEAAGAQGKFWEMHDLLCEHREILDDAHLNRHAQGLGLDLAPFDREIREHVYLEKVREDFTSGVESGVSETSAVFSNALRYRG
jgi:predicted DsbA family dithiol-disulfide isomerase